MLNRSASTVEESMCSGGGGCGEGMGEGEERGVGGGGGRTLIHRPALFLRAQGRGAPRTWVTSHVPNTAGPRIGRHCAAWPIVYFLQGRLGMAASFTRTYRFVCLAIVAKHLWYEQPVKEIVRLRDCTEISLFGRSEVYRSRPDVLGRSARGPARTFSG